MDAANVVYVNVQAEGARISPQDISDDNIAFLSNFWKANQTVLHVKLLGTQVLKTGNINKKVLFGNIGTAKIYLPIEKAALLPNQDPMTLATHLVSVVIEATDLHDEGNRVLFVNREKALETLKGVNQSRLKAGERAYGVIQRVTRGAYVLNVGGELAYLPRAYYDWDFEKLGHVGDEFPVLIQPNRSRNNRSTIQKEQNTTEQEPTRHRYMVVSRRDLLPNPLNEIQFDTGSIVDGKVMRFTQNGGVAVEIAKGLTVLASGRIFGMHQPPKINDHVTIRISNTSNGRMIGHITSVINDSTERMIQQR